MILVTVCLILYRWERVTDTSTVMECVISSQQFQQPRVSLFTNNHFRHELEGTDPLQKNSSTNSC